MKLNDALDKVAFMQDDDVIFAKRPWNIDSEATIGHLDENLGVPKVFAERGLEYFLEAPVAKEVLGVLAKREATIEERRSLLLYYAENDAYPDWVYR